MDKKDVCKHCGGNSFVETKHGNEAVVHSINRLNSRKETLYHMICVDCGTIKRSYVKNAKRLL